MAEASVDLAWFVEVWKPAAVDVHQVLHASQQLVVVKQGHVQVVAALDEIVHVGVRSESLRRPILFVFNNI
jgi:hypothetical protein